MNWEKVKELYPSLIRWRPDMELNVDGYTWFEGEKGQVFGISKEELTDHDEILLASVLKRAEAVERERTEQERFWSQTLLGEGNGSTPADRPFRFIFFRLNTGQIDASLIDEGLKGIFPHEVSLLWLDQQSGVIVEEFEGGREDVVDLHNVIELLMSDLSVNIHLFVGERLPEMDGTDVRKSFTWMKQTADFAFQHSTEYVSELADVLPPLLVSKLAREERERVAALLLKEAKDDQELLRTVQTYLEANSNITEAAKRMYMHRNSLQYRIDKFIDRTQIDIKTFQGAIVCYLALKMLDV
ncbi:PucR family transcriptional regulator [Salinibacillus aidingensis]|uniref:PucR family transcriptional regulator n=1 Tax=Salinibacillus aidingensis TaxID=237684 RepID=A0ABN1AW57_9BACI